MNRLLIALFAACMIALTACSGGGASSVEPGDAGTSYHGPLAPNDEEPVPVVYQDLTTPHTYEDGVIVTPRLTAGKVNSQIILIESNYTDDTPKKGAGYVNVALVVQNNSDKPFDGKKLFTTFTYGPNATEPEFGDDLNAGSNPSGFNTNILPGKSRTESQSWLVDQRFWNEVSVEIVRDGYPTLIYTGSVG